MVQMWMPGVSMMERCHCKWPPAWKTLIYFFFQLSIMQMFWCKITVKEQTVLIDIFITSCYSDLSSDGSDSPVKIEYFKSWFFNLQYNKGWTALHYATEYARWNSIHELLCWKPDLTCKTVNADHTALHLLLWRSERPAEATLKILWCLMEHENGYHDKVSIWDLCEQTVLHLAFEWSSKGNVAILEYLSCINFRLKLGQLFILHCIVVPLKMYFLLYMAVHIVLWQPTCKIVKCKTALHDAMVLRNISAALAIAQVADKDIPDYEDKTALQYAIRMNEPFVWDFCSTGERQIPSYKITKDILCLHLLAC